MVHSSVLQLDQGALTITQLMNFTTIEDGFPKSTILIFTRSYTSLLTYFDMYGWIKDTTAPVSGNQGMGVSSSQNFTLKRYPTLNRTGVETLSCKKFEPRWNMYGTLNSLTTYDGRGPEKHGSSNGTMKTSGQHCERVSEETRDKSHRDENDLRAGSRPR
ncbi:hypothetical protein L218DRAFT_942207 [Marasmius fiardii PR-910]|nr:hypothetical protein L218DRAFT_942207 [Marasmius fiardii PR-910]